MPCAGATCTLELAQERATSLGLKGAAFPWRTIQRTGVLGLLAGGHRGFSHQRRHRRRRRPLSGGERRRRGVRQRRRPRAARRDGSAVALVGPPRRRRALPDRRRDRSRRVQRDRRQQRLHQPDGRAQPARGLRGVQAPSPSAPPSSASTTRRPPPGAMPLRRCSSPTTRSWESTPQAEAFTEHEIWDFEATAPEQYPLLLHFPYFDLYRKQVVKQADLVLALHLRGDAFSDEEKARDFAYYERLTVRDSSLSASHAGGHRRRGRPPRAGLRLPLRGRADRSRRPPAQHARRAAHRIARRDMDRRRRGVWRDARPRRDPELRPAPAPGAHPAHVPPLLPWAKAAGGGQSRAGDLLAASRDSAGDRPSRQEGDGRRASGR